MNGSPPRGGHGGTEPSRGRTLFVTGGTGFVGARLVEHLRSRGHRVVLLVRPGRTGGLPECDDVVEGDPMRWGPWWGELRRCDAAVNLAGEPIHGRWTPDKKARIRDSRVLTTRNLVDAVPPGRPFTLFSASAVGVYGDAGERELDEGAPPGEDFLARVAREWEEEALRARDKGARVVIGRFAVVLGPGGALLRMDEMAGKGLAGPLGGGRQWVSWIHREDAVRAVSFLLGRSDLKGVFNLAAPEPVRQAEFVRTAAEVSGRRRGAPVPAFAVRLVLGEAASVVLSSQRMLPRRLLEAGFVFRFPELRPALEDVLSRGSPTGGGPSP